MRHQSPRRVCIPHCGPHKRLFLEGEPPKGDFPVEAAELVADSFAETFRDSCQRPQRGGLRTQRRQRGIGNLGLRLRRPRSGGLAAEARNPIGRHGSANGTWWHCGVTRTGGKRTVSRGPTHCGVSSLGAAHRLRGHRPLAAGPGQPPFRCSALPRDARRTRRPRWNTPAGSVERDTHTDWALAVAMSSGRAPPRWRFSTAADTWLIRSGDCNSCIRFCAASRTFHCLGYFCWAATSEATCHDA